MTIKELVAILNTLPSDATVVYAADRFIADEVIYDDYDNTVTFAGSREFGVEYEEDLEYIPDDIDESNYNPYMGCDDYDPADLGWNI